VFFINANAGFVANGDRPDATPILVSKAHMESVPDYREVSYFEERAKKLRIQVQFGNCDIHIFKVVCSDSRNRSQRLVNAQYVLHGLYRQMRNDVHTHTIEMAGSTFYREEMANARRMMAEILNGAGSGRKTVFMFESIGHSGVVNRGGEWRTDPSCGYHCGMTGGDGVARELAEELVAEGSIQVPATGKRFNVSNGEEITRFLESQYGFAGTMSAPGGAGYIHGIPDPKEHMQREYLNVLNYFSDEAYRGNLAIGNIRTFVSDLRDLSLWQVAGSPGGWSEWSHRLAQLEPGEPHNEMRTKKQEPQVMTICHMDNSHRSTVPLAEVLGLEPHHAPGRVFVTASGALERGTIGAGIHSGLYYFARHLRGKKLHIRGRTQQETDFFARAIAQDALCSWVVSKYGLETIRHDNSREEDLSGARWKRPANATA
jgi:hypothetical protein